MLIKVSGSGEPGASGTLNKVLHLEIGASKGADFGPRVQVEGLSSTHTLLTALSSQCPSMEGPMLCSKVPAVDADALLSGPVWGLSKGRI